MHCLKCGRETKQEQSFCDRCQEGMKQYPVAPDTVVLLPTGRALASTRKNSSRRKQQIPEQEQIRRLKLHLRRLAITVAVLSVLLIGVSWFAANQFLKSKGPLPGQNYSTVTSKPTTTEK